MWFIAVAIRSPVMGVNVPNLAIRPVVRISAGDGGQPIEEVIAEVLCF